jgi:ribonuclease HII
MKTQSCHTVGMQIAGVDEVGRGCWAGPVVAAVVVLDKPIPGLKDSKKLTKKRREQLAVLIREQAASYAIGWADAATVDDVGLTAAVKLAMERAVDALSVPYEELIVDGNLNYLAKYPNSIAIVKADDSVPAVSAASIIAKVARDAYMAEMALRHPAYGFDRHVGYGTAAHIAALAASGVSAIHRKSFKPVRALLELEG